MVPVENLVGRAPGHLLVDRRQRVLLVSRGPGSPRFAASRIGNGYTGTPNERDLAAFVRDKLGHEPSDLELFERALTHSSLGRDSYERLEFLGDRVLGLVIAERLYERYPNEPEGKLSRRYNALVARETCAEIGRELGAPALIRLGKQAREDGASESDNVVGDVVEALIGALVPRRRARGGASASSCTAWAPTARRPGPRAGASQVGASGTRRGAAGSSAPAYEVVARTGAHHAPRFTVRVSVHGSARPRPRDRASRKPKPPRPRRCWSNCR